MCERHDSTDQRLTADNALPRLAKDPIDNADAADPTEPMDSTDPTEPMDSTEPSEPIDNTELRDRMDSTEPFADLPCRDLSLFDVAFLKLPDMRQFYPVQTQHIEPGRSSWRAGFDQ